MNDGHTKYLNVVETYREKYTYNLFGDWVKSNDLPTVLIVGPSGVGKDTLAIIMAKLSRLKYCGSTSGGMTAHIYAVGRISGEIPYYKNLVEFYNNRHEHRQFFFDCCNAFRHFDVLTVPKQLMQMGANLVTGIRSLPEVKAFGGYCDHIIWVERAGSALDPTLEFSYPDLVELFSSKLNVFVNREDKSILLSKVVTLLERMDIPIDLSADSLSGFHPSGLLESSLAYLTK